MTTEESRQRHADTPRHYQEAEIAQAKWRTERAAQKHVARRKSNIRLYLVLAAAYGVTAGIVATIGSAGHHTSSGRGAALLAVIAVCWVLLAIREWRRS